MKSFHTSEFQERERKANSIRFLVAIGLGLYVGIAASAHQNPGLEVPSPSKAVEGLFWPAPIGSAGIASTTQNVLERRDRERFRVHNLGTFSELAGRNITLHGSGTPGRRVEIDVNDKLYARTTISNDARWTVSKRFSVPGLKVLQIREVDGLGRTTHQLAPSTVKAR